MPAFPAKSRFDQADGIEMAARLDVGIVEPVWLPS
jgi:hypothetical protein